MSFCDIFSNGAWEKKFHPPKEPELDLRQTEVTFCINVECHWQRERKLCQVFVHCYDTSNWKSAWHVTDTQ